MINVHDIIKCENILSLCLPQTLFQTFNQKHIQKTHWLQDNGTDSFSQHYTL